MLLLKIVRQVILDVFTILFVIRPLCVSKVCLMRFNSLSKKMGMVVLDYFSPKKLNHHLKMVFYSVNLCHKQTNKKLSVELKCLGVDRIKGKHFSSQCSIDQCKIEKSDTAHTTAIAKYSCTIC